MSDPTVERLAKERDASMNPAEKAALALSVRRCLRSIRDGHTEESGKVIPPQREGLVHVVRAGALLWMHPSPEGAPLTAEDVPPLLRPFFSVAVAVDMQSAQQDETTAFARAIELLGLG